MIRTSERTKSVELITALCRELMTLAKHEDDAAAAEASRIPYWDPCPPSVDGHRAAARVLRAEVERLEAETRLWAAAS
jgi:hypothetical protein